MATSRKRLWFMQGLLLLLLALLLRRSEDTRVSAPELPAIRHSPNRGHEVPRPHREMVERASNTPPAVHFRNFFLRPMSLGADAASPIPLPEAAAMIRTGYFNTAALTHEDPQPFTLDLSAANPSTVAFTSPRAPVTSVLRLLAAATGNRLAGEAPDFRFEAEPEDLQLLSRHLRMKPGTPEKLASLLTFLNRSLTSAAEGLFPSCDPNDFTGALRMLGLSFSSGLKTHLEGKELLQPVGNLPAVSPTPVTGLVENATSRDLALITAAIKLLESPAMQGKISTSTWLIHLPASEEGPDVNAGAVETEVINRKLEALKESGHPALRVLTRDTGFAEPETVRINKDTIGMVTITRRGTSSTRGPLDSLLDDETTIRRIAEPLGMTGSDHDFQLVQFAPDIPEEEGGQISAELNGSYIGAQGMSQVAVDYRPDKSWLILVQTSHRSPGD